MNPEENLGSSRREFIKASGGAVGASALLGASLPAAHAAGSDMIQLAFVGCGGRGSGAIRQALSTKSGPIKLVAMADAFQDRLDTSYNGLMRDTRFASQVEVPAERRFVGWDAYKHAMDCLKPGDVVILTTPPAFRWVHFTYAIAKGLNVFMEKPVSVDGPTSKKMFKLAEDAAAKNLKVAVGLMCRHYKPLEQLHDRIQNGELGEIILMRGYRMQGLGADFELVAKPEHISHLDYQVRHFHAFLWASGGNYDDFYIHHIDHLPWMKNAWPIKAQALGGRHYKTAPDGRPYVDQNFDTYAVEYTFPDGSKFNFDGRCMNGAKGIYSSYVHGTKGIAVAAAHNDFNGPAAIYKGQNIDRDNQLWRSSPADDNNPYQTEWDLLIEAVRNDKPYNEVKRGVEACLVSAMGRMAAHTGQEITYDQILNCTHEFAPGLDTLTKDTPAPLLPDATGFYPKPEPGVKNDREF